MSFLAAGPQLWNMAPRPICATTTHGPHLVLLCMHCLPSCCALRALGTPGPTSATSQAVPCCLCLWKWKATGPRREDAPVSACIEAVRDEACGARTVKHPTTPVRVNGHTEIPRRDLRPALISTTSPIASPSGKRAGTPEFRPRARGTGNPHAERKRSRPHVCRAWIQH